MQEGDGKAASRNPSCLSHGPEGQRETVLSLFSPSPSALGLHGGWSLEARMTRMNFLDVVRQDPEGGTFQILPRASPLANRG